MAAQLVTLAEAKDHLLITTAPGAPGDADLQRKLDAAEATILDYIGSTTYWRTLAATWTAATVPRFVYAAILLQVAEFDRFRGDDPEGTGPLREPGADLSPAVIGLLRRTRDPVLA